MIPSQRLRNLNLAMQHSRQSERVYLPTLAELIDRMSIVLLKRIFIPENDLAYDNELHLIEQDINTLMNQWHGEGHNFTAYDIRMIMMIMLANRWIWENEGAIRSTPMTEGVPDGYKPIAKKLIATHSINGVRNTAKNQLARIFGERGDLKVDCLAANLHPDFGSWDVFR